jgi:dihydrofolate reductase
MGKLLYSALASLDGYIADQAGNFEWAMPSAEVHAFVNDLERPIGTYLYGRRMFETMRYWETVSAGSASDPHSDYARIWQAAEKLVYSRSLSDAETTKTRLERDFNPTTIRDMKNNSQSDLAIGGATLAAEAFATDLIDEVHLFLNPVIVGGGTPALPRGLNIDLELLATRTFDNGAAYMHYSVVA